MMAEPKVLACVPWLKGTEANVMSQFGEDGLIRAVFDRQAPTTPECWEVGAGDGKNLSNTFQWRTAGWRALLIEKEKALYDAWFASNRFVNDHFVNASLTPSGLVWLLTIYRFHHNSALGVIDIDGDDLLFFIYLISHYRPDVVLLEHSYNKPLYTREDGQAGIREVLATASEAAYHAVAVTPCNVVLVRSAWMSPTASGGCVRWDEKYNGLVVVGV